MKDWTLRTKILVSLGAVLVPLLGVSGLAVWALTQQSATADHALRRMADALQAREVIISALESYQNQADTIINEKVDGTEFTGSSEALLGAIRQFATIADTAEERACAEALAKAHQAFTANYEREVLPRVKQLVLTQGAQERERLLAELKAADAKADGILKTITAAAEKGVASLVAEATEAKMVYAQTARQMRTLLLVLAALACLLGTSFGLWVAQTVNRQIAVLTANLSASAEQTTAAAAEVSSASQSLAAGASEQAASLEETSASLEEMASLTKRNAENSHQANDLAKQARAAAEKGQADMQQMSAAMNAIKASSDEIAKIIKTIDEIAFQTNILALNAAVEAARAGEAGMGFAVVAEEVRSLAQRSAQAAKETAAKIEGAIGKTAQGVELSTKVAQTLSEIVARSRQVDELAAEVASASREQSQGIDQVNLAVGQVDKVTQANAAGAEESASAAEELNAQAAAMKESVVELLKLVGGATKPTASNVPSQVIAPARKPSNLRANGQRQRGGNPIGSTSPAIPMPETNGHAKEVVTVDAFRDF